MIRVSFEAENASALKQQLQEFLDVTASAPTPCGEEGQQEGELSRQPQPADQKSKRGRPRKEQGSVTAEAEKASSPPPEAQTAVTDDPAITLDDLKALAVKVMDAGGGAQSVKLMAGFGYAKFKDVKPEHFAEIEKGLKDILAEVTK